MAGASLNKPNAKLTIIPYAADKPFVPAGIPFVAMYNPSTFTTSHGIETVEKPDASKTISVVETKNVQNKTVTVDLLLDATGASPGSGVVGAALTKAAKALDGVDVLIAAFFATTQGFNPQKHEPNNVHLIWGAGLLFDGVLESATVTYTLFNRMGRPIRATISATFLEAPTATSLAKIKNFFSSPDITKTHVVKAGDTLYNLAKDEYGSESFYLQIAEANDLKNYRKLIPGQVLIMPPVKNEDDEE